jgi:hypothetical protein
LPSLLAGDHLPVFGLDRIVEELDSVEELAVRLEVPFECRPWSLGSIGMR